MAAVRVSFSVFLGLFTYDQKLLTQINLQWEIWKN